MRFQAVIFDFDGTLVENEDTYTDCFIAVLRKHNVHYKIEDDQHPHVLGIGLEENWTKLHKQFGLSDEITITQLVHETQDEYHSRMSDVHIRPGFKELHEALTEEGIAVALATSNNWWVIDDELEDLGIKNYFNVTVTGEEVLNKKPEPDIFLEAAKKLFVEPEDCIVIEDSLAGILAGKEAGMKVVAIRNNYIEEEDLAKADLIIDSFEELNLMKLETLFHLQN